MSPLALEFARGRLSALTRFGLKTAAEELRLKLPKRSYHGLDAGHRPARTEPARKQAGAGIEMPIGPGLAPPEAPPPADDHTTLDADTLAELFNSAGAPATRGDGSGATDRMNRPAFWGAPTNPAGGDTGGRVGDLGQSTTFGGV